MYLKQADVFWGTSRDFNQEIMGITTKKSYSAGEVLFSEGQKASTFYILLKGRVKLTIDSAACTVYIVNRAGEAFGWSSLIDRDFYSATAVCTAKTTLLFFDRASFAPILQKYPLDGMFFFKKLAATLGNRLLQGYQTMASASGTALSASYGTGQVMQTVAND